MKPVVARLSGYAVFFLAACSCLARDPEWKLGMALDSGSLHATQEPIAHMYSAAWVVLDRLPNVQQISLEAGQYLMLGEDSAYVIAPLPEDASKGHWFQKHLRPNERRNCQITVRDQVLFHEEGGTMHLLDSAGEICALAVVRQEKLQADHR